MSARDVEDLRQALRRVLSREVSLEMFYLWFESAMVEGGLTCSSEAKELLREIERISPVSEDSEYPYKGIKGWMRKRLDVMDGLWIVKRSEFDRLVEEVLSRLGPEDSTQGSASEHN